MTNKIFLNFNLISFRLISFQLEQSIVFAVNQCINLSKFDPSSYLDVIGVVKSMADIQKVTGRTTAKAFVKRDLVLIDEKASIIISLWGEQVECTHDKN